MNGSCQPTGRGAGRKGLNAVSEEEGYAQCNARKRKGSVEERNLVVDSARLGGRAARGRGSRGRATGGLGGRRRRSGTGATASGIRRCKNMQIVRKLGCCVSLHLFLRTRSAFGLLQSLSGCLVRGRAICNKTTRDSALVGRVGANTSEVGSKYSKGKGQGSERVE